MAVKRQYSIPRSSEAIAVIVTKEGEEINVVPTREFYRLLSQWERLMSSNGVLAAVEDTTVEVVDGVEQNTQDIINNQDGINTANTSISQINADLVIITNDITSLATDLGIVSGALTTHTTASVAHGASGDIVGNLDAATLATKGVVNIASDPGDPTGTFVTFADVETWLQTLRSNLQAAGIVA